MMDYEQLRKDMEAGTQGDWWADPRSTEVIVTLGPNKKYVVADVEDPDDQRRIARVPQLERIALAAEEMEAALEFYADPCDATETTNCGYDGNMCCNTARQALASYRKATQ